VRIAEVVSPAATFNADTQRIKAQQRAAKRAALTLKLRKTQQQLSQLATQ
jgi:hypothetical protein